MIENFLRAVNCKQKKSAFADYLTKSARHVFLSQYKAFFSRPEKKRIDVQIKTKDADAITVSLFGCKELCCNIYKSDPPEQDLIRIVAIDITEQRKAKKALGKTVAELRLRQRIAEVMLKSSDEDMFEGVLEILLKHLDSRYGYFGHIDDDDNLLCRSLTRDDALSHDKMDPGFTLERSDWNGIWGKSLHEKRPIYQNVDAVLPGRHKILKNALSVPILNRDELIGQIVLAGKQGDFAGEDAKRLESVTTWIEPVLSARLERDRRQAQRIQAENDLLHAQRMESIGVLAGGVAHDFNNLLTPIVGYTDMLIEKKQDHHPDTPVLKEISRAALRAKDLINQLLAYSRKQMLQVKPLDINGIIENIARMITRLIRDDISVEYKLRKDVGIIKADAGQIDQILMNLAVNAQDAMPGGGTIFVETTREPYPKPNTAYPFDINPGFYTVLKIKDTGVGIPEDIMPFIFEPFFTTKNVGQGTGMGLATCYGIVEQHGGYIWVRSKPDKGMEFTIIFPSILVGKQDTFLGDHDGLRKMICSKGETVMVVEDDPVVRKMAVMTLKQLEYQVIEADSPEACLAYINTQNLRLDLLVTDVIMPGGNGAALFLKLKERDKDLRCPFMSGYSVDIISDYDQLEIGTHFISKPFTINALSIKVREVLDDSK
ncbi:MAG: ATP-binding protein [Desulfobacteraceae bacterium]